MEVGEFGAPASVGAAFPARYVSDKNAEPQRMHRYIPPKGGTSNLSALLLPTRDAAQPNLQRSEMRPTSSAPMLLQSVAFHIVFVVAPGQRLDYTWKTRDFPCGITAMLPVDFLFSTISLLPIP